MATDMRNDIFGETVLGKMALKKMLPMANLRIFSIAGIDHKALHDAICIKAAVFREPKSGPNVGKLCVMVPNSQQTVYITKSEIDLVKRVAELEAESETVAKDKRYARRWELLEKSVDVSEFIREYHSGLCLSVEAIDAAMGDE